MSGHENDKDLLGRLKNGDPKAVDELVITYRKWLVTVARVILRNEAEAEEIVQDFLVDLLYKEQYRSIISLKDFLFISIKNRCLSKIAKDETRKKKFKDLYIPSDHILPENKLETLELRQTLSTAVDRLPSRQSQVFHMAYVNQKSRKDIAREMGISENTVKSLLASAVGTLRELLQKELH